MSAVFLLSAGDDARGQAFIEKTSAKTGCHTLTEKQCREKRKRIHRMGFQMCNTFACVKRVRNRRERRAEFRRNREWNYWTRKYIPACTWLGESGPGPQFARFRYSVMNKFGSGARGKYQMMPGTYMTYAKYGDWSPLDQEIAAHRLFWAQGTAPWQAC